VSVLDTAKSAHIATLAGLALATLAAMAYDMPFWAPALAAFTGAAMYVFAHLKFDAPIAFWLATLFAFSFMVFLAIVGEWNPLAVIAVSAWLGAFWTHLLCVRESLP
jgi:hypothetical protein